MFPRVKGVADNFFDMSYWSGVIKKIETHLHHYHFSQIDIPILEYVSLFERGLGYQTEVVSKQMFTMQSKNTESDDKELICLRPEGTAGTMRAFLQNQTNVTLPARVFCYGPMFRYERPQKGRLREFHQLSLEILGAQSILYDAQGIKMLYSLFKEQLLMKDFILKINFLGEAQERKNFNAALVTFLQSKIDQLCTLCTSRLHSNTLRILDCKSESCQKALQGAPKLFHFFSEQTNNEWQELQNSLKDMQVPFSIDDSLVRGLDYYNKTVFEFVSTNLGAQNTFCGGGRYDGLAEQLGSKVKVPAFGAGIGIERLLLILEEHKAKLATAQAPLLCIIPLSNTQNKLALQLAAKLINQTNNNQYAVEILFDGNKIKQKMKQAHDLQAQFVLLLGDDEQKNGTVTVKNMASGEQQVAAQADLLKVIF